MKFDRIVMEVSRDVFKRENIKKTEENIGRRGANSISLNLALKKCCKEVPTKGQIYLCALRISKW